MVRGVSEDFWSTFIDPDPSNPKKRVVTVWGQGAVNVNTANAQTLLGVVCAGLAFVGIPLVRGRSVTTKVMNQVIPNRSCTRGSKLILARGISMPSS